MENDKTMKKRKRLTTSEIWRVSMERQGVFLFRSSRSFYFSSYYKQNTWGSFYSPNHC